MHKLSFFFVLLCFISFCLCLYNACDNPTSLADTPPDRLSYGGISNHCKQITSAGHTWKIYVLGGGSCMTIRDLERWGMLPVWYGTCFPPCPSQLGKCAAIGQLSCRDACQAYRSVTNQAETLQQEHLSLLSLLSLTGITRGDWSAKNTAQIFTSLSALHLPLIFLLFAAHAWEKLHVHFLPNVKLF